MSKYVLQKHEVMELREYAKSRNETRKLMINQRKIRTVTLTDNIRLAFENKDTIKYQIHEVIYASKTCKYVDVANEVNAYEHLIPSGNNLKATMFLEFEDNAEQQLKGLENIESTVYMRVEGFAKIWPITNEDIGSERIISPVHYLHFQFTDEMIMALQKGHKLSCGISNKVSKVDPVEVSKRTRVSLLKDFRLIQIH